MKRPKYGSAHASQGSMSASHKSGRSVGKLLKRYKDSYRLTHHICNPTVCYDDDGKVIHNQDAVILSPACSN